MEAHHAGQRPGMSKKAPDDTCIPLCLIHHENWHKANGVFKGWDKAKRREWADRQIIHTRAAIAEMGRAA